MQNFNVLHTQSIYVFLWVSEQIAGILLYNIKLMGFIAENQSVYCAVGPESLNKIRLTFMLKNVTQCTLQWKLCE